MNMSQFPMYLWLGCFASGLLGAMLGVWVLGRKPPQRIEAPTDVPDRDDQVVQAVRPVVESALAGVEARLVQGAPQWVRQAIQVELEFQIRQQAEHDEARALEQHRWQAEQEERRAAEFRALLQVLAVQSVREGAGVAIEPQARQQRPVALDAPPAPAILARPPELLHTPLPRPQPSCQAEEPESELSDDEIDVLPAELPTPIKPRKRVLLPPKKPSFRSL